MSRGRILNIPFGYIPPVWPHPVRYPFPRTRWLQMVENDLRVYYPNVSSADLAATARSIAPFELALGFSRVKD